MKRGMIVPAVMLVAATSAGNFQSSRVERADRALAAALRDRTPGAPVNCIHASSVSGPEIIDRDTVLYQEGRTVWRNELATECRALEAGNTMVIEVNGGQLCNNDRFRMVEPGQGIPGPYCRLGKFTPYRK